MDISQQQKTCIFIFWVSDSFEKRIAQFDILSLLEWRKVNYILSFQNSTSKFKLNIRNYNFC